MSALKPVPLDFSFPEQELKILEFWKEISAFEQSIENRHTQNGENNYAFYDGPPFATGLPHYGHFVASTLKDVVPRYWTMRGKCIERRFGWDTHGLPIEMETEKALGVSGPSQIKVYGVEHFNEACRSRVLKHTEDWEKSLTRLGRWVDFKNNYKTMDKTFMESVWWVFSQLWEKKLVYQDFRVMPYSWRLSTPLSNFEANSDYRSVQDPAVTVQLKCREKDFYFLIWTTTPWTLPSNLAIAVGKDIDYVTAKQQGNGHVYVVAENRIEAVLGKQAEILSRFKGIELAGLSYEPPFDDLLEASAEHKLFYVLHSDHVRIEEGTGLVHMAPAFGQEDFEVCKQAGIPLLGHDSVDEEGRFVRLGLNIKEADSILIRDLKERNILFKQDTIQHNYPYCWRSGTPLIYKAIPSWFVQVTAFKERLSQNNKLIHWVPEFVGEKRFGNWLEDAQDWCISRNRFWGTPIPIWQCEQCLDRLCIGSIVELEQKVPGIQITDLHPHKIDHLSFSCTKCSGAMRRIPEVFDCWFESGSMPYAQNHYPFENQELFKSQFPADFIAEGLDQTRAWFYTLLVLSTALFDSPPFKNVIVNGLVLASDGSKMSKSKKNYPDPNLILEQYGADALRTYLIQSPVVRAEPLLFQEQGVREVVRNVLLPLYHVWSFLVQYANIDGWDPETAKKPQKYPEIDRWILSKLNSLIQAVNQHMEGYYLYKVVPSVLEFIDDLTNWYIRRSRRRFWRNATEPDAKSDKEAAYATLYEVLINFSKLIAPMMPFMAETLYQALKNPANGSVHSCDYPTADSSQIDLDLEQKVETVRRVVNLGRSLREKHKIKTRQPLAQVTVVSDDAWVKEAIVQHEALIAQELNVKKVQVLEDDSSLCHVMCKANFKTLGKRFGSRMQEANALIIKLSRKDLKLLQKGENLIIAGEKIELEDIVLTRESKTDMVLESFGNLTVGLETKLSHDLIQEGLAREVVSQIQKMRKDSGFDVTDRIQIMLHTESQELRHALSVYEAYLQEELLAAKINWQPQSSYMAKLAIDKQILQVSLL